MSVWALHTHLYALSVGLSPPNLEGAMAHREADAHPLPT